MAYFGFSRQCNAENNLKVTDYSITHPLKTYWTRKDMKKAVLSKILQDYSNQITSRDKWEKDIEIFDRTTNQTTWFQQRIEKLPMRLNHRRNLFWTRYLNLQTRHDICGQTQAHKTHKIIDVNSNAIHNFIHFIFTNSEIEKNITYD